MNSFQRVRHIHIESGPLALDYQGGADQIHSVAAALAAMAFFEVTVDDDVRPGTPVLPCGGLWEYPDPAGEAVEWPATRSRPFHTTT